ncbi:hypothetical protein ONZ51_g1812 [Trametes cubensis]|uniref:Enoyl-CoA hydratase/isomerase domain-containing protein n=1 Tax=Trametes cubensis TaxID=1111947 RepID=A0AAD7U0S1_9APHY|nr:hypothetical protein ONZ51_g1812 [Trametes cubensis]
MPSNVTVEVSERVATITFNSPKTLNAITLTDFDAFVNALRAIDARDDVLVTIWQANGTWFSSGGDITSLIDWSKCTTVRGAFMHAIAAANTDFTKATDCPLAVYTQQDPGRRSQWTGDGALCRHVHFAFGTRVPALTLASACIGFADFIYALPCVWLSAPFALLGTVAEGGCSVSFRNKMGAAKANEVLIWGKKKGAQELLECGFINEILPEQPVPEFHNAVRRIVLAELEGLDPAALLGIKRLIKAGLNDQNDFDAVNLRETYALAERFASGVPADRLGKVARKELKHKL